MAKVRIKILSAGRIPGYNVNGPVLNPISVEEEEAMRFINAGLDVRVWNDQVNDFVKFSARDMLDFYHDKNYIGSSTDEDHDERFDDCVICDDVNILIKNLRVNQPARNVNIKAKPRISSNEPLVFVIEEEPIPENYVNVDDKPVFGDEYEEAPVKKMQLPFDDMIGLDDFEEK